MLIQLKDFTFKADNYIGHGVSTLESTHVAPEYFVIYVYLRDVAQPVMLVYDTLDARDADVNVIVNCLYESR